ncbi:hypothetical protein [Polyangium spumosum]|uniref:Uncharacterized protein n=1 Tax=Polyangium spumosum TaxID=889282 RepID=A0A6N7PTB9_9BACT|nr:hypothetical protein [Polyangium spumosum]MRG95169.1 hypothetical protein [Polyangium spumosum]
MDRARLAALASSFAMLVASCAPTKAPEDAGKPVKPALQVASASAPTLATPREPSPLVRVTAPEKLPANLSIDGDVSEWGSLAPPPDPKQPDAPSRLSFALTKDGAFVAAELVERAKDGIWLVFGLGGTGGARADDTRFERVFRLDKRGLSQVSESGALVPVVGSVVDMRFTERGTTLEARIPVAAYPRAAAAPITEVLVHAVAAEAAAPPKLARESWIRIGVPEPVHFEPHAELRAEVYRQNLTLLRPLGISYSPADPGHIEITGHLGKDGAAVATSERPLYVPERRLGDVEVGYTFFGVPALAVFKAGKLLELVDLEDELMGSVERNKQIHVFSYAQMNERPPGFEAGWLVIAVAEDGSISYPFNAETGVSRWEKVYEIHSDKLDWFGMRGVPLEYADEETPRPIEILWRFDKPFGGYMPTTRPLTTLPPPRPRKKKP